MQSNSILLIEDGEASRLLLTAILQRNGFAVATAKDGESGLAIVLELRPALVILDVMLPGMNGFEVCERIKADESVSDTPIIFVTGLDDLPNRLRGLSTGGVDYIGKPFVAEEVLARVRAQIALRGERERRLEDQRQKLESLRGAQASFLTDLGSMPESRCEVYFESAEESGGDQYDVMPRGPGRFGYCVSDIAGHGIEAGFLSTAFKALFRENAKEGIGAVEVFQRINALMSEYLSEGQHITASYLELDRDAGKATILSAGHLPVILTGPSGELREIGAEGDVLGAFVAPLFEPVEISVPRGWRFWLLTDGVVEDFAERRSWRAGMARLEAILPGMAGLPLGDALCAIKERLFSRHPGEDDRVLLACEA